MVELTQWDEPNINDTEWLGYAHLRIYVMG